MAIEFFLQFWSFPLKCREFIPSLYMGACDRQDRRTLTGLKDGVVWDLSSFPMITIR